MRLSYPLCALCLTAACASDSPTGHPKGVLTDATMNTVTIVTEKNDTLQFSTEQADRTEVDGLLLGDTVEVFFQGKYRPGMQADKLISRHPQPDGHGSLHTDGQGEMLRHTYEGLLPAASGPGIVYRLTVCNREHSGDGTFSLTLTYKEAEDGQDKSFTYRGRRYTQRGIPEDDNATVWQCVSDDGKETFNFLRENDSTLTLLGKDFERPQSSMNYSLTRTGRP